MQLLDDIELNGKFSHLALSEALNHSKLNAADRNLLTELVYGVLQRKLTLDFYLNHYLKKQKRLENWIRQLLRISIYQKLYLDRIPDHAIIHEAVEIAKIKGHRGTASLVNGVLRNIQRHGLAEIEEIEDITQKMSIQYSLPIWMVKKFIKQLGMDEFNRLGASLLKKPKTSLRVNTSQMSRDQVVSKLKDLKIQVKCSKVTPYGIILENQPVQDLDLFQEGILTVQDESSMLVAPNLDVKPNHRVLDACAAPGGKTTHIASEFLDSKSGGVTALDLYDNKLKLIEENAKRQKVSDRVEIHKINAKNATKCFEAESFDRILVDAPCSGLGLMRRKPEIRYHKTPQDIFSLQKEQLLILESVSQLLKPGGILIYSTCTFTNEENQEVIDLFLRQNPYFVQEQLKHYPDSNLLNANGAMTIHPHNYGTDGFFIAKLTKQANK